MGKIKVAVIGLGAIGERVLNKFQQHPEVEVAAICDRSANRLEKVKEQLGTVDTYIDHQELLKDKSINLVYLAVPPKFHHQIALDVLKEKKHLLCEKPLANSTEEAKEMMEVAEAAKVVHAMNFPMVYTNVFHEMKEKVSQGELGSIKKIELNLHFTDWPRPWQKNDWISSREQGGFIREVAPHYIQMMMGIFGELNHVKSFVDYPENVELCETGFISKLELANGVPILLNGQSGIGQKEHLSFKVYGDRGTFDLVNWSQLFQSDKETNSEILPIDRADKLDIIEEIIKAIEGKPATLVTFKEGYEVQKVLEEILANK